MTIVNINMHQLSIFDLKHVLLVSYFRLSAQTYTHALALWPLRFEVLLYTTTEYYAYIAQFGWRHEDFVQPRKFMSTNFVYHTESWRSIYNHGSRHWINVWHTLATHSQVSDMWCVHLVLWCHVHNDVICPRAVPGDMRHLERDLNIFLSPTWLL